MVFALHPFFFTPSPTTTPCVGHTATHPLLHQVCHHFPSILLVNETLIEKDLICSHRPFTPPIYLYIIFSCLLPWSHFPNHVLSSPHSYSLFTLSLFSISPTLQRLAKSLATPFSKLAQFSFITIHPSFFILKLTLTLNLFAFTNDSGEVAARGPRMLSI